METNQRKLKTKSSQRILACLCLAVGVVGVPTTVFLFDFELVALVFMSDMCFIVLIVVGV
jgi:hypothetical protein